MIKPESGIMQMLQDPDEGRFTQALLGVSPRAASLRNLHRRLVRFYTGMPDVVALWGEKIFGPDGPTKRTTESDRAGPGIAAARPTPEGASGEP